MNNKKVNQKIFNLLKILNNKKIYKIINVK